MTNEDINTTSDTDSTDTTSCSEKSTTLLEDTMAQPENYLSVDPLIIKIGRDLIPLADPQKGGDMLDRIHRLRCLIADEIGLLLPSIRIRDSFALDETEYKFYIDGQYVAGWNLMPTHYLAIANDTVAKKVNGIETIEPAFGTPSVWVDATTKAQAESSGYTVVEPAAVIITHFTETVRKHADVILTVDITQRLLDKLQETSPVVVDHVLMYLTIGQIRQVLQLLLHEQIPIKRLETILGVLLAYVAETRDPVMLATFVREKLARTIGSRDEGAEKNESNSEYEFSTALLNCDTDLEVLTNRIMELKGVNFSLCLYGVPGSGKSAYARFLAEKLKMKVLHKRASDLFSKWLGESEQKIAAAFAEAKKEKKLLIFDEADSFLRDRRHALHSWEVSQVNEMLTQMESHPLPFVCTTNLMEDLDHASLRRFTFKVKYDFLTRQQTESAFKHFFGSGCSVSLGGLTCLSPGDFAVVAKKAHIFGIDDHMELTTMLRQEQEVKGVKSNPIVFSTF